MMTENEFLQRARIGYPSHEKPGSPDDARLRRRHIAEALFELLTEIGMPTAARAVSREFGGF
jgi:hypothetical protein